MKWLSGYRSGFLNQNPRNGDSRATSVLPLKSGFSRGSDVVCLLKCGVNVVFFACLGRNVLVTFANFLFAMF